MNILEKFEGKKTDGPRPKDMYKEHVSATLKHILQLIQDLEVSRNFYENVGFEFIRKIEHGDKSCIQMKSPGGLVININETANVNNPSFSQYAVEVDNLEEMAKEL